MGEWDPSKASSEEIPHSTKNETQTQYLLLFIIKRVVMKSSKSEAYILGVYFAII